MIAFPGPSCFTSEEPASIRDDRHADQPSQLMLRAAAPDAATAAADVDAKIRRISLRPVEIEPPGTRLDASGPRFLADSEEFPLLSSLGAMIKLCEAVLADPESSVSGTLSRGRVLAW